MIHESTLFQVPQETRAKLLSGWEWLLPKIYLPLYSTAFGDLFLSSQQGTIYFLNTLDGKLIDAADNEIDLHDQLSNKELQDEVFMPPLAVNLFQRFGSLKEGHCYSVIVPPSIGGKLTVENFHVLPLFEHLAALGSIQHQVANDPPGTKYRAVQTGG